ncbi:MAG: GNAT family N-acetyltransferase [Myxococcaceae bacterium]
MTFRRSALWLLALIPGVLVVVGLTAAHHLPARARAAAIDLNGLWKVHEGQLPVTVAAMPDFDDTHWKVMEIPGRYLPQGFRATDCWLRREFTLPSAPSSDFFLALGNTSTGVSRVFVNGNFIGEKGAFAARWKSDWATSEGWLVPRSLLSSGRNVVAIQHHWLVVDKDWQAAGFLDSRQFIGPAEEIQPALVRMRSFESAFRYGPLAVFAISALLMVALAWVEKDSGKAGRYLRVIAMIVNSTMYLDLCTGLTTASFPPWARVDAQYVAITSLSLSFLGFSEAYYLGKPSRYRPFNWALWTVFTVGGLLAIPSGDSGTVYALAAPWLLGGVAYQAYLTARDLHRQFSGLHVLMGGAILTVATCATIDFLTDLGVTHAPPLFDSALAIIPIVMSLVVIGDFLKVYGVNRELSLSLTKTNARLEATNTHLGRALLAAQEATRVKGEFLANVSHELRTPLNTIINVPDALLAEFSTVQVVQCRQCGTQFELEPGETLHPTLPCGACGVTGSLSLEAQTRHQGEGEAAVRHLTRVKQSGEKLLAIVDQVLDISRFQNGGVEPRIESVRVTALLDRARELLRTRAGGRRVRIQWPHPTEGVVDADPAHLPQALAALVDNAVKFSSEGGEVRVQGWEDGDDFFWEVADDGIGIAPENHGLIFESFRQVDGSDTRKYGGNGLGLTLAKHVIELHGGGISLQSALGKGTRLTIRLPKKPSRVSAAPRAGDPTVEPLPLKPVKSERDFEQVAQILGEAFQNDGFWQWMAGPRPGREARIYSLVRAHLFAVGREHAVLECDAGGRFAALWKTPGHAELSLFTQMSMAPQVAPLFGWGRVLEVMRALNRLSQAHPPGNGFRYLACLGVLPDHQGKGLGSALMKLNLSSCEREGVGVFLETANARAIAFYERLGFRVTNTFDLSQGGPRMWTMVRPPA